jgi:hypothetical protein
LSAHAPPSAFLSYTPDPRILELGEAYYDPVEAADFPRRS